MRLEPLRAVLDGTVYKGHEGLREWLVDIAEDWEYQSVEVHEIHALESGEVAARGACSTSATGGAESR